jgi:hypothetical protein
MALGFTCFYFAFVGLPTFWRPLKALGESGLRRNFGKWCRVRDIGRGFTTEIGNILLIVDWHLRSWIWCVGLWLRSLGLVVVGFWPVSPPFLRASWVHLLIHLAGWVLGGESAYEIMRCYWGTLPWSSCVSCKNLWIWKICIVHYICMCFWPMNQSPFCFHL